MNNIKNKIKENRIIYSLFFLILAVIYNILFLKYGDLSGDKRDILIIGCIMTNITLSLGYLYPVYLYIFSKNKDLLD